MSDIINLVIYASENVGLSYYDENWGLYAVQVKHINLVTGYKGSKKHQTIIDWLPNNWLIA